MPFLTQGKTNWKFLLIVIVLAAIVGGVALWFSLEKEQAEISLSQNPSPECSKDEDCGEGEICLKGDCVVDETADWQTYKNEEYGFEMKYPEEKLLSLQLKTYEKQFQANNKIYPGIQFGSFYSGCSLVIFKTDRDSFLNPFDESNIPIKERQYAVSKKLDSGDAFYHLGMSVASHAVSPEECKTIFNQMFYTFRFIEIQKNPLTVITLETNKVEYDHEEENREFYLEEFYATIKNKGNFPIWYDCMARGDNPSFELESYENGKWGEGSAVLFSNSVTFLGALGRSPEQAKLNPQERIIVNVMHTFIPGYKYRLVFYPRLYTFCMSDDCLLDTIYSNEFIIKERPELIQEIIGTLEFVDENELSEFGGAYVFKSKDGTTFYAILADGELAEKSKEFENKEIIIRGYKENSIRLACLGFKENVDGDHDCKEWVDQTIFIMDIKTAE